MTLTSLNPQLSEGSGATLTVVLIFMCLGALLSFWLEWQRSGCSLLSVYIDRKSTVAFAIFCGAFAMRTGTIWWTRYSINHGLPIYWDGWVSWVLLASSCLAAFGGMCWLRETSPEIMGTRTWAWLTAFAFACGTASVWL